MFDKLMACEDDLALVSRVYKDLDERITRLLSPFKTFKPKHSISEKINGKSTRDYFDRIHPDLRSQLSNLIRVRNKLIHGGPGADQFANFNTTREAYLLTFVDVLQHLP